MALRKLPKNKTEAKQLQENEEIGKGYHQAYQTASVTIRNWFVTFGIVGPAAFFLNDKFSEKFLSSPNKKIILWLFLIGSFAQVFTLLLNRWNNWLLYRMYDLNRTNSLRFKICIWISDQFEIDVAADLISCAAFVTAIIYAAGVVLN